MAGYEKKEGDIAVFFNAPQSKTNPNSPDWSGEALIDGKVMRVAFWIKSPTMIAGKIEPKTGGAQAQPASAQNAHAPSGYQQQVQQTQPAADIESDEIPFS